MSVRPHLALWLAAATACAAGDRDETGETSDMIAATDGDEPTPPPATEPDEDPTPVDAGECEVDGCGDPPPAICAGDTECTSGPCIAGACVAVSTCAELHDRDPARQSGRYVLDPDLDGPEPPLSAYCDMATDGGGWTILYAADGRDGNVPVISHDVVDGNPLAFEHYNLHTLDKIRLSDLSSEMLVRRPGPAWLVADAAPITADVLTPTAEAYFPVMLRASDGTSANGWVGWSNYNIDGGGDFGITSTDGATCDGWITTLGFDHHNAGYWNVNCNCARHYLYSLSADVADGDASYHAGIGLGGWTATSACTAAEGTGDPQYLAVR